MEAWQILADFEPRSVPNAHVFNFKVGLQWNRPGLPGKPLCTLKWSIFSDTMTEKKRKQVDGDLASIFVKKAKHELLPSLDSTSQVTPAAKQLSLEEFALLLDFSSVQEEEEIKSRLDNISRSLLHDFRLAVRRADGKETEFQVLEAEFYLQIEGIHDDPFTHGSEEQKFSGRWHVFVSNMNGFPSLTSGTFLIFIIGTSIVLHGAPKTRIEA